MTKTATDTDIIVIGAGIIGVTAAHEFLRAGYRVRVLDREGPGAGASHGNAGHFATEQIFPIADASILWQVPRLLLDPLGPLAIDWRYAHRIAPWLLRFLLNMRSSRFRRTTEALARLSGHSRPAWDSLLEVTGGRELIRSSESLTVFEKPKTGMRLERDLKQMRAYGVLVDLISRDEARERVPALGRGVEGALHFTATGHVADPLIVLEHVWAAARRAGVAYRQAEVRDIEAGPDRVRVHTDDGVETAGQVVIACGAHSKPLVRQATGVHVPLDTERGYHLMLPAEQGRLPMAVGSAERRFMMTPMSGGLRLAGTVEFAGLQRPANWKRAWVLRRHAEDLMGEPLDADRADTWMGFRPTLPDCLPVIDRTGPGGRVLMAFGHQHLGFTQAAFTARLLTDLVTGQPSTIPLEPYRVTRFSHRLS